MITRIEERRGNMEEGMSTVAKAVRFPEGERPCCILFESFGGCDVVEQNQRGGWKRSVMLILLRTAFPCKSTSSKKNF